MSQQERDRLKVLHEVQQKQLTQVAAAERLKVSDRHVRRMLLRLREREDRSLVHGLPSVTRASNYRVAGATFLYSKLEADEIVILDCCPNLIHAIPSLVNDPSRAIHAQRLIAQQRERIRRDGMDGGGAGRLR